MAKWPVYTVQQLVELGVLERPIDGNHGSIHPKSTDFVSTGIPFIMASDLKNGYVDLESCAFISEEQANRLAKGFSKPGDILLSHKATIGRTAIVQEFSFPYIMLTPQVTYYRIKDKAKLNGAFLRYYFNSRSFLDIFEAWAGGGSTRAYLGITAQLGLPIPIPPISIQKSIAELVGPLDDKIELNRRMNETLEAMARAIFKDWFVDFGPTRAKMEGRAPYLAPEIWALFPDRHDDEWKPEGWALRPVGDFAELRGGKQLEKERITSTGTIPVFGGAGVMGFTDKHNADGFIISVGRVGAYCGQFFSHRGKVWINNNASLVRQYECISGEWLFHSLQHADIEVIKKGAAQPFVSNSDIANMPIIWPGENIVSKFAEIVTPLMLKMEENIAESSTLAATRDLLLPKLMSGEIRVRDAEEIVGEVA